jgi:hypothetical protein
VLFEIGQRLGLDILPRHFYSSVPDMRALRRSSGWRQPFAMHGVAGADIASQIAALEAICPEALRHQWATLSVHETAVAENGQGGGYGAIEADVLHAFIRHYRPRRIVQVGCGVSTSVIIRAAKLAGYAAQITCVEPYPSAFLTAAEANGRIELHREGAEGCAREVLTDLSAGDLLFVDSTHAVRPGSEVNRIILDVLPRLAAGVLVHFHDIHFPYDYQRALLREELFFSSESTLLHAYLADNARCRILLSLSMLHYAAPEAIARVIPHYEPQGNDAGLATGGGRHFPSATYLAMTGPAAGRP